MIVFVHGVPETAALWDQVRASLKFDSVALSLPGFGCPRPDGFAATKDDYVKWLLDEIAKFDQPVDLVGHDWGAILTARVATMHGNHIRSWVTDALQFLNPKYVWHDLARIWQTPVEGEAFWADQIATPVEQRASVYEFLGVPTAGSLHLASMLDETMATCILDLYRSAVPNPSADWNEQLGPTSRPGMVLLATEDPFGEEATNREFAELLGAHQHTLAGLGHWWALQEPVQCAKVIEEFVDSIG